MTEQSDRLKAAQKAIRGNFDRCAPAYNDFEAKNAFFAKLLEKLLSLGEVKPGARVLDVGCGTGASLLALEKAVGEEGLAVGLDISLGMLKEARKIGGEGTPLVCMDGCGFGDGFSATFDAVVYNAVLFLLPDADGSLKSALKVLKPGGVVLIGSLDAILVNDAPLAELLTSEGHTAGRHFLSPWPRVEESARALFERFEVVPFLRPMDVGMFRQFYTLEPMSAGLLPKTPYPERVAIVNSLADRFDREGVTPVQRWMLGVAKKS